MIKYMMMVGSMKGCNIYAMLCVCVVATCHFFHFSAVEESR